jgi:hypothetical protein
MIEIRAIKRDSSNQRIPLSPPISCRGRDDPAARWQISPFP